MSRFDPRVLEKHLPRGDGDDRKPCRRDIVERGGLGRDLVGLDQRVLGIAADELVVCRAVHGVAEREHADAGAERRHRAADVGAERQRQRLAHPAFADQPVPRPDACRLHGDQHLARPRHRTGNLVEPDGVDAAKSVDSNGSHYSSPLVSSSFAISVTRSGSKPNFRWSSLSGADAPNVFMPMMRPDLPT